MLFGGNFLRFYKFTVFTYLFLYVNMVLCKVSIFTY